MTIWLTILGLVLTTIAIKGFGPVLFGGRQLPEAFTRVISLMAPALLAALVLISLFADGQRLTAGAQTLGVAVGGVLVLLRRSIVLAVVVAVAVTAVARAVF